MTIVYPPPEQRPHPGGYVPAVAGADGNEDPAPESVVHAAPPATSGPELDERAERQSEAARRVGQLLLDFAEPKSTAGPLQPGESVCTACDGRGKTLVGVFCVQCAGSGVGLAKASHLR